MERALSDLWADFRSAQRSVELRQSMIRAMAAETFQWMRPCIAQISAIRTVRAVIRADTRRFTGEETNRDRLKQDIAECMAQRDDTAQKARGPVRPGQCHGTWCAVLGTVNPERPDPPHYSRRVRSGVRQD